MDEKPQAVETTVALKISNTRKSETWFCLEPWGEWYPMESGNVFEVIASGPEGHFLEVDYAETRITVYAWPGSVAAVFHNGVEIMNEGIPVPSIGSSLTVKDFLQTIFGKSDT